MAALSIITVLLLAAYGLQMNFYRRAWNQIPLFSVGDKVIPTEPKMVSVVVPARNEETHIASCLESLLNQSWPRERYEILVVDDHSTDRTAEIAKSFDNANVRVIALGEFITDQTINAYKKKAIETAIAQASGEWILSTDADCILPPDWILTMMRFAEESRAAFIAAPVMIREKGTLLSIFQSLDFATLQGITGAVVFRKKHRMCNGANLGYEKKIFGEVGGFAGVDGKASGDDMLLMEKVFEKYPDRVFFLKSRDAMVVTNPQPTWKSFLQQRSRWASKAGAYMDRVLALTLAFVFSLNLVLLIFFFACLFRWDWLIIFISLILCKTLLEFPLVRSATRFFGNARLLPYFLFFQPVHILYMVIAGLLGNLPAYRWKGRKVH